MSEKFIKFIPSPEAMWLLKEKPNSFKLLAYIAVNARTYNGHPDGLLIGECHIGNLKKLGLSQTEYRTAKKILLLRNHIKIIETSRTREKSTDGTTTHDTLVQIISSNVWDINSDTDNGQPERDYV